MQKMNEIRYHIRAVEQTRKITNAMHLISSSRIKKIMPQVEYNRLYLSYVQSAMHHILMSNDNFNHPYLHDKETTNRDVFIVVSGDKGMVGSYNADLLNFALSHVNKSPDCHLVTLGMAADHFFRKQGIIPDIQIMRVSQDPSLHNARHITQDMFRLYDDNIIDRVFVVYTKFINSVKWYPAIHRLLPLDTGKAPVFEKTEEMIYHPSAAEMFDLLIPQYTIGIIYGALMNAYVSENCARMNSMQSATRNADELLKKLKTRYNIARQSAITQEITEITQTALAMGE